MQIKLTYLINFWLEILHFIFQFFSRISEGLEECLPNLESIILTGNLIQELGDIDVLSKLTHLRYLSLLYNPVQSKPHYRQYIAYKLPQLKVLDFNKIKKKVRI